MAIASPALPELRLTRRSILLPVDWPVALTVIGVKVLVSVAVGPPVSLTTVPAEFFSRRNSRTVRPTAAGLAART